MSVKNIFDHPRFTAIPNGSSNADATALVNTSGPYGDGSGGGTYGGANDIAREDHIAYRAKAFAVSAGLYAITTGISIYEMIIGR